MVKAVLTCACILLLSGTSIATHIVGGEFEILHIEGDRYLFRQIQYFDVVNGNPQAKDQQINASIFRKSDNLFIRSVVMFYTTESLVPYSNPECTTDRLITNRIEYSAEVRLDPNLFSDPEGYYMVWERCCRNNIITNIVVPDETGQTFYIEFPPIRKGGAEFRNSSPQLFPPLSDYACVNRFYFVDFRGTDPDGDSLVYSLNTPSNSSEFEPLPTPTPAPHPTVTWVPGMNSEYQIPGNPTLQINDRGFLTVTPSQEGLFVFSVKCEEFRDGVKIGEVIRDFQLFVIDCPDPGNAPEIQVKAPGSNIFESELETIVLKNDDDKCFDFSIRDKDGSETILIRAEAVNFEANLQSILSANIGYIDRSDDTLGIQVCLPDCPYLQDEPFIIDIIAQDYTCPQSLMDTMRLSVIVEPPPNRPPKFITPLQNVITASFIEGTEISLSFSAEDPDLDSLLLTVVGLGFELEEYGIEIDTIAFEDGRIDFNLNWDTNCSKYPFGLKNQFQLIFYVEDADLCGNDDRDSVILNITIDLPANNSPTILVDNDPNDREVTLRIEEGASFNVRAFDGDPSDILYLEAIGIGFDLADIGIEFENQVGKSNVRDQLELQIDCEDVDLFKQDSYQVMLIAEDEDKCKLQNADTLLLTLNILPPINNPPRLYIDGQEPPDTIYVDAGSLMNLEVSGIDDDGDEISLEIMDSRFVENLGIQFAPQSGYSQVYSQFNWQTDCSLLGDEFSDQIYNFTLLLNDDKCVVPLADTVDLVIVIQDEKIDFDILAPNVFTPNDADDINRSYYIPGLPKNNCERQFEGVMIFNRYGVEVFSSNDRDFQWSGEDHPNGVYYYLISYTDFSVKGTVSIIR